MSNFRRVVSVFILAVAAAVPASAAQAAGTYCELPKTVTVGPYSATTPMVCVPFP